MPNFWQFKNISNDKAELLLYGPISESSWWDDVITPKKFAKELKDLRGRDLDVRINSGGGDVFAAHAIHSLLKAYKGRVDVYIDGLAASAASIIAMAGDTVYIPSNAMIMIHDPWTFAWGNADELQGTIEVLEKVKDSIIAAYQAKTNKSYQELYDMMKKETWLTGKEAVEFGFADVLLNEVKVAASISGDILNINGTKINTEGFKNMPKFPVYQLPDMVQQAQQAQQVTPQQSAVNNSKEGVAVLNYDEILASLPVEQQTVIKNAVDKAVQDAKAAKDKEFEEQIKLMQANAAPLQGIADSEDLLASADPEIRALFDKMKKDVEEAQNKLREMEEQRELQNYIEEAKKFSNLAVEAEKLGGVLKNLAKNDPSGYEIINGILKAANEAVTQSNIFDEQGKSNAHVSVTGDSAWAQINALAIKKVEEGICTSVAQATTMVMRENPELYNEYQKELKGGE